MNDETQATGSKKVVAILLMVLGVIAMIATGLCTVVVVASIPGIGAEILIGIVPFSLGILLYFWGNWLRRRP